MDVSEAKSPCWRTRVKDIPSGPPGLRPLARPSGIFHQRRSTIEILVERRLGWHLLQWFYSASCNCLIWCQAQWFVFIVCTFLFCFVVFCCVVYGAQRHRSFFVLKVRGFHVCGLHCCSCFVFSSSIVCVMLLISGCRNCIQCVWCARLGSCFWSWRYCLMSCWWRMFLNSSC